MRFCFTFLYLASHLKCGLEYYCILSSNSPRPPDLMGWRRQMSPFLDTRAVYPPRLPCCYLLFSVCGAFIPASQSVSVLNSCFSHNTQEWKYRAYVYGAQGSATALENYATCPWSQPVPIGNPDPRNLIATALLKKLYCTFSILKLSNNLFNSKT